MATLDGKVDVVDGVVDAILDDTGTSGVVVASLGANSITAAAAASDFGTEIGTAVWASTTRLLTAGTNIALAKGTGVTGFTDLAAAGVRGAVGLGSANLDTQIITLATASAVVSATNAILSAISDVPTNSEISAALAQLLEDIAEIDFGGGITVSDILTTTMTESYAANGQQMSLAQALYGLQQHMMHFQISGTSRTVKKLNGAQSAFVETLDDATSPTGLARS